MVFSFRTLTLLSIFLCTTTQAKEAKKKVAPKGKHEALDQNAFNETDEQLLNLLKQEKAAEQRPIDMDAKNKANETLKSYLNAADIAFLNNIEFQGDKHKDLRLDISGLSKAGLYKSNKNGEKISDAEAASQQLKNGSLFASSLIINNPEDSQIVLTVASYYLKAAEKQKMMKYEKLNTWESYANKAKILLESFQFKDKNEIDISKNILNRITNLLSN